LNKTNTQSKTICSTKYSKRAFIPVAEARLPPMLYTFPGSGNTWCRLLIEYGLGIYSGLYPVHSWRAVRTLSRFKEGSVRVSCRVHLVALCKPIHSMITLESCRGLVLRHQKTPVTELLSCTHYKDISFLRAFATNI
jgi:hypothetical protein